MTDAPKHALKVISLRSLHRIERELERAGAEFAAAYPVSLQNWTGSSDDMETVRNLDTAKAHISAWIAFRDRHGRDPYLRAAIAKTEGA